MPLIRDDVIQAYRLILGRVPESEAAITGHLRDHPDLDALRRAFLGSEELHQQLARPAEGAAEPARLPLDAPPLPASIGMGTTPSMIPRYPRATSAAGKA